MTVADRDLFAWRMRGWREQAWGNSLRAADEYPGLLEMVEAEVAAAPGTARQIESRLETDHPRDRSNWGWNWSLVKQVCEALFWAGRLSTVGRNSQFERIYIQGHSARHRRGPRGPRTGQTNGARMWRREPTHHPRLLPPVSNHR